MAVKRDGRGRLRDYDKEYERDHKSKKDKKDRNSRNTARSKVNSWRKRYGKPKLTSNQTVDHKDSNPRNNSSKNLRVVSQGKNSAKSNKERAKKR